MKFLTTTMVVLLAMTATLFAQVTQMKASNKAPSGIINPPQFIIVGSDDNTNTEGVNWMANLMSEGTNENGTKRYMSFYVNSRSSTDTWEKVDGLSNAVFNAYELGHEIGNHTATHLRFVGKGTNPEDFTIRKSAEEIYADMKEVSDEMVAIGIPKEHQFGFRTPFLSYSDSAFTAMQWIGFLYDCSINTSYSGTSGKANFPYTLDSLDGQKPSTAKNTKGNIPPDNTANWWGTGHDGLGVGGNPIREHKGLWTIPCSKVTIADEDTTDVGANLPSWASYIKSGWTVTGLDYNLWMEAYLDSAQSVRALVNTVNKHLNGNRSPFSLGVHSQYYFTPSDMPLDPMSLERRQGMFEEFVRQASLIPEVFFVSADMVIAWMEDPCEAEDFTIERYHRDTRAGGVVPDPVSISNKITGNKSVSSVSFAGIKNGQINLQLQAGNYSVELYNLNGRLIRKSNINAKTGLNVVNMKTDKLSKGIFVLNVKQNGISVLSNKVTIK